MCVSQRKMDCWPPCNLVRGYFEIKRLKTRGVRQPGNSVCIKTPVFLKIPKTENTKIPGFQALYLQIASKTRQNSGNFSNASAILSGSTSMYNFAVSSGEECRINRCTVVRGTPASGSGGQLAHSLFAIDRPSYHSASSDGCSGRHRYCLPDSDQTTHNYFLQGCFEVAQKSCTTAYNERQTKSIEGNDFLGMCTKKA